VFVVLQNNLAPIRAFRGGLRWRRAGFISFMTVVLALAAALVYASRPGASLPVEGEVGGGEGVPVEPEAAAGPVEQARLEPVARPDVVRGLYLNAWAAGSKRKLAKLLDIADRTEINTFVIDVKEGGRVSYDSDVPLVNEIGSDARYIPDIRYVLEQMRAHGVYPIARIVVFKDAVLASAKPEWAVQRADGTVWRDHHGDTWVDSFNQAVWDYNIAIAREAIELGFAEVQWDYVRFPDVPRSYRATAVWPAAAGRTQDDGIREFLLYAREQLADLGVPVTADVFGQTVSIADDMGIGQKWEKVVDAVDVVLPMVYPSHFGPGVYGLGRPNANPYETVYRALRYAVERSAAVPGAALIRPWLQDFTLGPPRYGPYHVRAQIQAVYDAGLTEWILWNPGSNYTAEALGNPAGDPPEFWLAELERRRTRADSAIATPVGGQPVPDSGGALLLGRPVRPDTIR